MELKSLPADKFHQIRLFSLAITSIKTIIPFECESLKVLKSSRFFHCIFLNLIVESTMLKSAMLDRVANEVKFSCQYWPIDSDTFNELRGLLARLAGEIRHWLTFGGRASFYSSFWGFGSSEAASEINSSGTFTSQLLTSHLTFTHGTKTKAHHDSYSD